MIKALKSQILAILIIFFVTCLMFFKIPLKGLYPVPADLLVSFYFPWYSGGWEGYNPWTTHKELLNADSIRQIYLWKEFALEQFKKGKFPLWSPYTFSGQPLLANFQSSVFYPFNIFYFLTDPKNAWILLIVIQPFFGGYFMYLALKSFKISQVSSLYGAIAFMFSSYLISWMENGNIANSYIWMPLAFWSINNFFAKVRIRYLLILSLAFSLSILAGHPQTSIYILITCLAYFLYKIFTTKASLVKFIYFILTIILSLGLTSIQLLPTLDFYKDSPISLPFAKDVFDKSILPFGNLISFFASDFFGHPASNNYWSRSYGDFTPYFGVIPLMFMFWAIFHLWKKKFIKFATFMSALFILAAVRGPITYLIQTLHIPLLDATSPARFVSISIFMMITLSSMGFENFLQNFQEKKYLRKFFILTCAIASIYLLLWLFATIGQLILEPRQTWQINLSVTRRNLILPTFMFLSIPISLICLRILTPIINADFPKKFIVVIIFAVTLLGGVYYSNKFLPAAPKKFIFPPHPVFSWLKTNAKFDRFYGGGTAHIDYNFPTHYRIFGAEGYDSLRLRRYAELVASGINNGSVPQKYLRSEAVFVNEENGYRARLFELLGVQYLLDKEDNPKTGADWHYERFPNDNVLGIAQYDKFQFYERQNVLPRAFTTTSYQLVKSDREIIDKIYDRNFPLTTLLLEKEPNLQINGSEKIERPQITKYEPNEIDIVTNNDYNSLLFLSDTYSKDWRTYIDGRQTPLLRADYALRAVAVPAGQHQVTFRYQPRAFIIGAYITVFSIILFIFIIQTAIKFKKF